jgi:hypothetical protein
MTPDREFDEVADAIGSYNDAIAAIGVRVKAGEPIPEYMRSQKTRRRIRCRGTESGRLMCRPTR